jgi:hypothetical protein
LEVSVYNIIALTWTGQAFTGIQMLAMRNAAARHLRGGRKAPTFHFKHDSLEGEITRTKVGSVGTFNGMIFHADCGQVKGERWTMDFLIPDGTEQIYITGEDTVILHRYTPVPFISPSKFS